ncbi:hypothetical protein C0V97_12390 [Asaia sp. W19]|uniref:hypothetical protein n=1 Tax=unclassified Asaia TaxID=2685023 RepID=UPI000F8EBE53|nr:hypothetical protein [Asaia sp. W19]RUT25375.1 hypothetical protein C0V97_12390 [Asaia sp. W19]
MSKFKVGDRVKAVKSDLLYEIHVGKEGVVYQIDADGDTHVRFSCGDSDSGYASDFELLHPAENAGALKESLQNLHKQFLTAGDSIPAFALKEVISEHFGVAWQEPQEGRWVEKENAA